MRPGEAVLLLTDLLTLLVGMTGFARPYPRLWYPGLIVMLAAAVALVLIEGRAARAAATSGRSART